MTDVPEVPQPSELQPSELQPSAAAQQQYAAAQAAARQRQAEPPRPRWWRRLWPFLVGGWALVLLALALWSASNDPPTVRDQTDITTAKQTIETVVGTVRGLTPATWQFTDQGYEESRCDLTVSRDGVEVTRLLTLSGPAGTEVPTLTELAGGLAGARLHETDGTPDAFFQDAGYYVEVRGRTTGPGTIVVRAASGCRAP